MHGHFLLPAIFIAVLAGVILLRPVVSPWLWGAIVGTFLLLVFQTVHSAGVHLRMGAVSRLESRINPHFFFNTLNTIGSMVEREPLIAKELIVRLGDMFRTMLDPAPGGLATVEREVELVRNYLAIERARFGDRLRVSLPEEIPPGQIPPLSIQPLVENAVKYGVAPSVEGGSITLAVVREHRDCLVVTVTNTVDPAAPAPNLDPKNLWQGEHALNNVRFRLHLLFGRRNLLSLNRLDDGRVQARMVIPQ